MVDYEYEIYFKYVEYDTYELLIEKSGDRTVAVAEIRWDWMDLGGFRVKINPKLGHSASDINELEKLMAEADTALDAKDILLFWLLDKWGSSERLYRLCFTWEGK